MDVRKLTPSLSVAPQISVDDIALAKSLGFKTVICNRPNGESDDQPELSDIATACEHHDMTYVYQPVISGNITDDDVDRFSEFLDNAEGPILAFCRTGTRCSSLWAMSQANTHSLNDILATAQSAGYDLSGLTPRIQAKQADQGSSPVKKLNGHHHDVLIVGGGAAGQAAAASLFKRQPDLDIAIIEPRDEHHYQPGWTMVGGGVFDLKQTIRPMSDVMPSKARWYQAAVERFEPDHHRVVLDDSESISYRILIVAAGLTLNWEGIKGLKESLGRFGVTSNYHKDLSPYTWELVQSTQSGKALFTQPPMPIKCAGAPQKAMYLACDHWQRQGVLSNIDVDFCTSTPGLFGVADYVPALMEYITSYGINLNVQTTLTEVDGNAKCALFKQINAEGETVNVEKSFDMLHVTPPQTAPLFIAKSPLADASGWVDISAETLQHVRYKDVFALGDAGNTPNAKTAAAVRKQAPIVAENVIRALKGKAPHALYDGYGSCPLTVERGKIVLAEFGYGGKILPSLPTWLIDGKRPTKAAWLLKEKFMPWLYFNAMLKGREWLASPNVSSKDATDY